MRDISNLLLSLDDFRLHAICSTAYSLFLLLFLSPFIITVGRDLAIAALQYECATIKVYISWKRAFLSEYITPVLLSRSSYYSNVVLLTGTLR